MPEGQLVIRSGTELVLHASVPLTSTPSKLGKWVTAVDCEDSLCCDCMVSSPSNFWCPFASMPIMLLREGPQGLTEKDWLSSRPFGENGASEKWKYHAVLRRGIYVLNIKPGFRFSIDQIRCLTLNPYGPQFL